MDFKWISNPSTPFKGVKLTPLTPLTPLSPLLPYSLTPLLQIKNRLKELLDGKKGVAETHEGQVKEEERALRPLANKYRRPERATALRQMCLELVGLEPEGTMEASFLP